MQGQATRARVPRAVSPTRVSAWYAEAMALLKRSPLMFFVLAATTLATEVVLHLIPIVGAPLANMVEPLVACSLLYASLAADRREPVRARFTVLAFAASPKAVAAVILASVVTLAFETATAAWIAGVNLLDPGDVGNLSSGTLLAVYFVGLMATLPFTFVPFAALFDGAGVRESFAASLTAFGLNVLPLAMYGALSFVLVVFGVVTLGAGLLLALPLWAASSYAAWKDIFAVEAQAGTSGDP